MAGEMNSVLEHFAAIFTVLITYGKPDLSLISSLTFNTITPCNQEDQYVISQSYSLSPFCPDDVPSVILLLVSPIFLVVKARRVIVAIVHAF